MTDEEEIRACSVSPVCIGLWNLDRFRLIVQSKFLDSSKLVRDVTGLHSFPMASRSGLGSGRSPGYFGRPRGGRCYLPPVGSRSDAWLPNRHRWRNRDCGWGRGPYLATSAAVRSIADARGGPHDVTVTEACRSSNVSRFWTRSSATRVRWVCMSRIGSVASAVRPTVPKRFS